MSKDSVTAMRIGYNPDGTVDVQYTLNDKVVPPHHEARIREIRQKFRDAEYWKPRLILSAILASTFGCAVGYALGYFHS